MYVNSLVVIQLYIKI